MNRAGMARARAAVPAHGSAAHAEHGSDVTMTAENVARIPMSAFFRSAVLFGSGFALSSFGNRFVVMVGAVFVVLSLIDAATLFALKWTTAVAFDGRVIQIRYGLIRRVRVSMPLSEIKRVFTQRSWLGERLNYGALVILGSREGIRVQYLQDPERIQGSLEASMAQDG